tara:strand:- start:1708 stop:3291 length:1584 start_codon:yes stop_codon:yes gene_type:complete
MEPNMRYSDCCRAFAILACLLAPTPALAQGFVLGDTPGADAAALTPDGVARAVAALPGQVADIMVRSGVPGMAIAVVHGGEVVFLDAYGVRDMRTGEAVTTDTVFQIASISKPISATVAAIAVSDGQIGWKDPVRLHLPEFALSDAYVTEHGTIGDFFAHRSGLPMAAGDDLEDLGFDRAAILARLKLVPLDQFRTSYRYANFGTTIAAEAVAAAYGREWEDLADELLFDPLGMDATSYRHADYLAAEERAALHALDNGAFAPLYQRNPDAQAPAGGVSSSVRDMAKWVGLLLGDGRRGEHRLFAADALLPALQLQINSAPSHSPIERSSGYGYGFNVGVNASGRPNMSHSGAFVLGAATAFQIMPAADVGIVVLSNGAPVGAVEALVAQFMDIVQFGEPTRDWFAGYNGMMSGFSRPIGDLVDVDQDADAPSPNHLATYVGTYDNAYFGAAQVEIENGGLTIILGPNSQRFSLAAWDGSIFAMAPHGENAPAGSLSSVKFTADRQVASFVIDYLNGNGLGTWTRSQ